MEMGLIGAIVIAFIIGMTLVVSGLGYKIGGMGNAQPIQCACVLAAAGTLYFGGLGLVGGEQISWLVILISVGIGFTQYAGVRLMKNALQMGPFSPVWCSVSLAFIPVIIYAAIALGETLSCARILSILSTGGAIVSASLGVKSTQKAENIKQKIIYGILLVLILAFVGCCSVGLKVFENWHINGAEESVLDQSGNYIMQVLYFSMMIFCAVDLTLYKAWQWNKLVWGGCSLLIVGGLAQFTLLKHFIHLPAIILFALSNSTSILLTALISALFLHEKRTASWYATLLFSTLAILLNTFNF